MSTLLDDVAELITRAGEHAVDEATATQLEDARRRLDEPLRVAIAGRVKAGKSTLLNALLGEELAPTDAGECTKIVTWYRYGAHAGVTLHLLDGSSRSAPWSREDDAIDVDLGELSAAEVDHLEIAWPTSRLRDLTIIDTPGIASISADVSARTHTAMIAEEGRVAVADAVIYLMRHTHASDVRFLEAFHDDEIAHGTSMNALGVLSRADEIGSCRLDALETAATIADRYVRDPRLHRLCPVVLPVAGLLGFAGVSLREAEFAMLRRVVDLPPADAARLLLTADRFATWPSPITELERGHLLARLGLFGVRLAVELVRSGQAATSTELSQQLGDRSGLQQLRSLMVSQFEQRSRILKSLSALSMLDDVLARGGCSDADALGGDLEQLRSSTHEFAEVRLLSDLHAGVVGLRPDQLADLERLVGGSGHDAAARLALPETATTTDVLAAAVDGLERWRRVAEHPMSSRSVRLAAGVGVRTLEGLIAASYQPGAAS